MDEDDAGSVGTLEPEMREVPERPDRRVLRRNASDRVVAGVASGLADYFDISPLAVRTLFGLTAVVIAFENWTPVGLAVVAYLLLWFFVPRSDVGVSAAGQLTRRFPRIGPVLGLLVLLGGAAALVAQLEPGLGWAVLLIGGGALLFLRDGGWGRKRSSAGPEIAQAGPEIAQPTDPIPAALEPVQMSTATEPLPFRTPRPPRERSPLGWFGLGIALLVVGGAAILQNLGAIELRLVHYSAIALLILGVTMLVGAFAGRARWLVLPSIVLIPVILVSSMITVPLEGGVGDVYEQPQSVTEIDGEYRRIVGGINLYLTALRDPNTSTTITASSGVGEIYVTVPFDAHVIATGRTGIGGVHIGPRSTEEELDAFLSTTLEPRYGDGATITLDLETGIGAIWVTRQRPTQRELRELEIEP